MLVRRIDDPRFFLEAAAPLLLGSEARHNMILGVASTLIDHPAEYPKFHLWLATTGEDPLAAALMTPPFNVVIADSHNDEALDALVAAVHEDASDPPGAIGNVPTIDAFVDRWRGLPGVRVRRVMSQGVYALENVREPSPAPGLVRRATGADRELIRRWLLSFYDEALPEPERASERMERILPARLLGTENSGFWLWEDRGRPVSLAGFGSRTPNGIRIGPVYTPPEHRRHGYATSLVAELSAWLLSTGRRFCFLFTDLANPTSNAIYERIGYARICESAEYTFER